MVKVVPVVADGGVSPDSDGELSVLDNRLLEAVRGRTTGGGERIAPKQTPLHLAARFGHRDNVDLLLEKKARFAPLSVEFRILKKGWIESDIVQVHRVDFLELYCYLASVCTFFL